MFLPSAWWWSTEHDDKIALVASIVKMRCHKHLTILKTISKMKERICIKYFKTKLIISRTKCDRDKLILFSAERGCQSDQVGYEMETELYMKMSKRVCESSGSSLPSLSVGVHPSLSPKGGGGGGVLYIVLTGISYISLVLYIVLYPAMHNAIILYYCQVNGINLHIKLQIYVLAVCVSLKPGI